MDRRSGPLRADARTDAVRRRTGALAGLPYWSRSGRPERGVTFGVGYLSHVFGDAIGSLLIGEFTEIELAPSPGLAVHGVAGMGFVLLWLYDCAPGAAAVRRYVGR